MIAPCIFGAKCGLQLYHLVELVKSPPLQTHGQHSTTITKLQTNGNIEPIKPKS